MAANLAKQLSQIQARILRVKALNEARKPGDPWHCLQCEKKMYRVKDPKTGKLSDYIWHCKCMPKDIDMIVG